MGLFGNLNENDDNKKAVMVLGIIIVMVVILALVTYLFFYNDSQSYDNTDIEAIAPQAQQIPSQAPSVVEEIMPDSTAESLPGQIAQPADVVPTPVITPTATTTPSQSSISSLKYTIKPNDADIFSCVNMKNGRWDMPKKCGGDILNAVQRLIDNNAELIAIEVSGIVDNNPYAGPSAELKQEGLASFRAREGIIAIMRGFSNVAAFEGPSMQLHNKRGFQVKAYYLQK